MPYGSDGLDEGVADSDLGPQHLNDCGPFIPGTDCEVVRVLIDKTVQSLASRSLTTGLLRQRK